MRRTALLLLGLAAACGGSEPRAPAPAAHALRGTGLGTSWTVKWRGDTPEQAVEAAVVQALADVDAAMSTWRDDSDLARVRAAQGPVPVAGETAHVVQMALDLAEASGGAFDPTVQPLVELWGFHGQRPEHLPDEAAIAGALAQLGWQRVRVSHDGRGQAFVDGGGTALDLSAIAKGWAVDRVSYALSALGEGDHLVEVGGEMRVHGHGPSGRWTVGVDVPDPDVPPSTRFAAVLAPVNAAVATSGDYRNRVQLDGEVFGHTLDPRTGRPARGSVLSATVVAPDCATADGWATALMVLGPEGVAHIEARPELEALLLVDDGAGGFSAIESSGFARWRAPAAPTP